MGAASPPASSLAGPLLSQRVGHGRASWFRERAQLRTNLQVHSRKRERCTNTRQ